MKFGGNYFQTELLSHLSHKVCCQVAGYTAISRKVVGKNVHATIPKGNTGYDQFTVPDTVAFAPTFVTFL